MPQVFGPITLPNNNDNNHIGEDIYKKGGYRVVNNLIERDNIPSSRRKEGMLVYVVSNATEYRLANNLTSWNINSSGGSSLPVLGLVDTYYLYSTSSEATLNGGISNNSYSNPQDIYDAFILTSSLNCNIICFSKIEDIILANFKLTITGSIITTVNDRKINFISLAGSGINVFPFIEINELIQTSKTLNLGFYNGECLGVAINNSVSNASVIDEVTNSTLKIITNNCIFLNRTFPLNEAKLTADATGGSILPNILINSVITTWFVIEVNQANSVTFPLFSLIDNTNSSSIIAANFNRNLVFNFKGLQGYEDFPSFTYGTQLSINNNGNVPNLTMSNCNWGLVVSPSTLNIDTSINNSLLINNCKGQYVILFLQCTQGLISLSYIDCDNLALVGLSNNTSLTFFAVSSALRAFLYDVQSVYSLSSPIIQIDSCIGTYVIEVPSIISNTFIANVSLINSVGDYKVNNGPFVKTFANPETTINNKTIAQNVASKIPRNKIVYKTVLNEDLLSLIQYFQNAVANGGTVSLQTITNNFTEKSIRLSLTAVSGSSSWIFTQLSKLNINKELHFKYVLIGGTLPASSVFYGGICDNPSGDLTATSTQVGYNGFYFRLEASINTNRFQIIHSLNGVKTSKNTTLNFPSSGKAYEFYVYTNNPVTQCFFVIIELGIGVIYSDSIIPPTPVSTQTVGSLVKLVNKATSPAVATLDISELELTEYRF